MILNGVRNKRKRDEEFTVGYNEEKSFLEKIVRRTLHSADYKTASEECKEQMIYVCIAKSWINDTGVWTDGLTFLNEIWSQDILPPLWNRSQFFKAWRNDHLEARRDDLIIGNVRASDAEHFVSWLNGASLQLRDFDISKLKGFDIMPNFTPDMDRELLEAVGEQEGLFMDPNFLDWNIKWIRNHEVHEQVLRSRFRHFSKKWDLLLEFFDFNYLLVQEGIAKFRQRHGSFAEISFSKVQDATDQVVQGIKDFNERDYRHWMELANKVNCPEKTMWLKACVEKRVLSMPVKIREKTITASLKSLRGAMPVDSEVDNVVTQKLVHALLNNGITDSWINSEENNKFPTRHAMLKVSQLLTKGKVRENVAFSQHDAVVFQSIKKWEMSTTDESEKKVNSTIAELQTAYHNSFKRRILNARDIESILFDEETSGDGSEQLCEHYPGRSTTGWKIVLDYILENNLLDHLKSDETWYLIREDAEVTTGKSVIEMKDIFFRTVLPNVEDFFEIGNFLNLFKHYYKKYQ